MWQHSACLGISQVEAEKDDFHFICQDCRRREEDAKKPKIPSLKFRVAPTSSPPDQKSDTVKPIANEARKRKRGELDPQQQLQKNARHSATSQQMTGIQSPRPPHAIPSSVPNITTNGLPTYVQGHSYHSKENLQKSPKSPPKASAHTNGYDPYPSQPNGCGQRPPNQSFQPPPFMVNGYHHSHTNLKKQSPAYQGGYNLLQSTSPPPQASGLDQQHFGWSARYVPPQLQPHSHSPNGPPPAHQNPFANTLNDHRPPSSHRPSSSHDRTNTPSLPSQNPPVLSPSKYQTPTSSFNARPHSSATSQINGFPINQTTSSQPVGPPSQSPKKETSPPSTRPIPQLIPSTSPIIHHPTLPAAGSTSPGFSPVKHALPQQQSLLCGHGKEADTTKPSTIAKLAPSLVQQNNAVSIETPEPEYRS